MKIISEERYLELVKSELELQVLKLLPKKSPIAIDIDIGDPSPIDPIHRKMYVAAIAGHFKDILEPKLKQMLSSIHNDMEGMDYDDNYLKGASYLCRELMLWGNRMVNEQVANQEINNSEEEPTE